MKLPSLLALSACSLFGVACQGNKTAQNDPYNQAQPYGGGATQQDPYATAGEYDNVYAAGGGENYEAASTYQKPATDYYSQGQPQQPAYSGGYSQPQQPAYSGGGGYSNPAPSYNQGGNSHTVQRGDTLFNISRRYGTSVDAIRRANGINGDLIRIGEQLVIP